MKKMTFKELKKAHLFNISHKTANVSLDPSHPPPSPLPPKGLYFSILGEKMFPPFLKKAMPPIIRGNVELNYPLTWQFFLEIEIFYKYHKNL